MGEPTLEDTAPEELAQTSVQVQQPMSATWAETWVNVVFPTLFGMVAGAFWQASISPQLTYGLPNPPPRWFAHHDALLPPAPPLAYASSSIDVARLPRWYRCPRSPAAVCLVHRDGWFRVWRVPHGRALDLGQHFVVAISPSSVPIGHLAHHGRQHRCLGRLVALSQPDDVIRRCTIPRRWGNPPNAHRRNSP